MSQSGNLVIAHGHNKATMEALDCCACEVKAEPFPQDYCFVLQGVSQNNSKWTWSIERLAFPSLNMKITTICLSTLGSCTTPRLSRLQLSSLSTLLSTQGHLWVRSFK